MDLIPVEYRYWRWQKKQLKRMLVACIIACVSIAFMLVYIKFNSIAVQTEVALLTQEKALLTRFSQNKESLTNKKLTLEYQHNLLKALRGGMSIPDLLKIIDSSLTQNKIWFDELSYERNLVKVSDPKSPHVHIQLKLKKPTGKAGFEEEIWATNAQTEIKGNTSNYSALSNFVNNLLSHPYIQDVKIRSTSAANNGNVADVAFDLLLTIKDQDSGNSNK